MKRSDRNSKSLPSGTSASPAREPTVPEVQALLVGAIVAALPWALADRALRVVSRFLRALAVLNAGDAATRVASAPLLDRHLASIHGTPTALSVAVNAVVAALLHDTPHHIVASLDVDFDDGLLRHARAAVRKARRSLRPAAPEARAHDVKGIFRRVAQLGADLDSAPLNFLVAVTVADAHKHGHATLFPEMAAAVVSEMAAPEQRLDPEARQSPDASTRAVYWKSARSLHRLSGLATDLLSVHLAESPNAEPAPARPQ